jgi:hypothetical protein
MLERHSRRWTSSMPLHLALCLLRSAWLFDHGAISQACIPSRSVSSAWLRENASVKMSCPAL